MGFWVVRQANGTVRPVRFLPLFAGAGGAGDAAAGTTGCRLRNSVPSAAALTCSGDGRCTGRIAGGSSAKRSTGTVFITPPSPAHSPAP
jgi:hypothetical protein